VDKIEAEGGPAAEVDKRDGVAVAVVGETPPVADTSDRASPTYFFFSGAANL
jgi:hypothetical protein